MRSIVFKKISIIPVTIFFIFLITAIFLLNAGATVTSNSDLSIRISACTLSFDDSVYVMYAVPRGEIPTESIEILYFDHSLESGEDYTREKATAKDSPIGVQNVLGEESYVFKNKRMNAKNMTDTIYARAYANIDGAEYYSNVVKYSILEYAYNTLGLTSDNMPEEKLEHLLRTMLSYGAASQDYFGYKTDRLATDGYVKISVTGGHHIDGFDKELVKIGDYATIYANEYPSNLYICWYNSENELVAVGNELTFKAKKNESYRAIAEESPYTLTIDGNNGNNYSIYYRSEDEYAKKSAEALQDAIYEFGGCRLSLTENLSTNQIRVLSDEKDTDRDGFRVNVENGNLILSCQYPLLFEEVTNRFIDEVFKNTEGKVDFNSNYYYGEECHYLCYSDFGAVGDGVTDDFNAIKQTHERANLTGQSVIALPNKIYNMGKHSESIKIMTDTVWTGAEFIIDDSSVDPGTTVCGTHVFTVTPSMSTKNLTGIDSLSKGDTNLGISPGGKYIVHIQNSGVKQYIRYGANADSGDAMQEILLVESDGSISPETPLLWDYEEITSAVAYYADDRPLTITGGSFITIANKAPRYYTYYNRGINVMRSNVTVSGLSHTITGEGTNGAPYNGFLCVQKANNVTFENIVYTGHKTYSLATNASNKMGSYDINATLSSNVTWKKCTQTNSITDSSYWGVMGSNYCKNLTYDDCSLSRFDAHKGVYNATVKNSEIGHGGINAIGAGRLTVEGTIVRATRVVYLRADYGSTWQGEILIKDVTLSSTSYTPIILQGNWYNHDFGYTCYLPEKVIIDNFKSEKGKSVNVFHGFNGNISDASSSNPVIITEEVVIKNTDSAYAFNLPSTDSFKNTVIYYE